MWQLQGFDSEAFVSRYWQREPCVLRNAIAEFESPISPEELAGLACEEDVHCRLVIEKDAADAWQVRYGPFEEQDFLDLPETHYSLLVSECEKWMPELNDLLDRFRFVPDWRIDDLMLSYAPQHGSVGPHVDEYDVFLLQALGRRRWLYSDKRVENPKVIAGLELAILETFDPDHDIVLEPGDILYLPPGIAHHGIALDRCMTYSIGFRAPSAASALESFALETERLGSQLKRYRDPDLQLDRHHAEITAEEIGRFRTLATELLEQSEELWQDAIGKMLSDSSVLQDDDNEQPVYVSDLLKHAWSRHPDSRMLYYRTSSGIRFYYNGRLHLLPDDGALLQRLQQFCDYREWSAGWMNDSIKIGPLETLLLELATNGAIIPIEE